MIFRSKGEPVKIGGSYEILKDTKSLSSGNIILKKGEYVTAMKAGAQLFLVQAKTTENGPRRCWVPAQWLVKLEQSLSEISMTEVTKSMESELDTESLGERTYSEYSSAKSYPESDFSTEISRTSSAISTEGSLSICKLTPFLQGSVFNLYFPSSF